MIKVENIETWGFKHAIRGMRNPKNSWSKSDSTFYVYGNSAIGENDLKLMKNLVKAGQEHRKFMRQIFVSMDITAPFYFYKQFETYKIGTVSNACSTMHKITSKPIEMSDFSVPDGDVPLYETGYDVAMSFDNVIDDCETLRKKYLETKDKRYWDNLIALLPEGYNQKRTVTLNYEVLYQMYRQRKNHKLKEWHDFCDVIKTLPYAKELIVCEDEEPFTFDDVDVGKDLKKAFDELGNETTHIKISDGYKIISEWDVPTPLPTETIAATSPTSEIPYISSCQNAEDWSAKLKDLGVKVTDDIYECEDKMVSHPDHYQSKTGMEVIDVIESFTEGLDGIEATDTGNIIKYACRWKKKGKEIQDVEKIIWYATHLLAHLKKKRE